MKIILHNLKHILLLLIFGFLSFEGFSQTYTITGNVNASSYSCSTFNGYTTISIGDGTTFTKLIMNANLDLIAACSLGPLRIIVNNATLDFSTANKILTLPEGSSIEFINGGALFPNGGTGGGCTGNDRIYIGTKNIAACQGSSGVVGFDDVNSMGGTGAAYSNSPVCLNSTINLFATPPPIGSYTYAWTGPNGFSSTLQNPTLTATSVTYNGLYKVAMKRGSDNKFAYGEVTVTVNSSSSNTVTAASSSPTPCISTTMTSITHTTTAATGIGTATGLPTGVTAAWSSNTITISGTPTQSGTFNYSIPLTGGCGNINATGTIIVNPLPSAAGVISGTASVCQGQSSVSYSVAAIANSTSYTWAYSGTGATITGTTNSPTITFSANATSGNLTVRGANTCGNGVISANYPITVNTLSVAPTAITGTTTICNGGSTTLTVSGGTLGTAATVEWFTASCGGTAVGTGTSITVSPTVNTTYYVRYNGTCNTTSCASTTVTVNALPNNITNGFAAATICAGGSPQLTYDADDTFFTTPYSITYKNDTTLQQYTVSIPTASPYSFTPGDNPTTNNTYTLVSISNASCTNSVVSSFLDSGASLIVRPMATATISGSTSICSGSTSPNITFTNPRTVAITVTYNVNGGSNQTIGIGAGSSANVSVSTSTSGTFIYNLVSATYQTGAACSNIISGSATVIVNPNLPASVSIAASPSGAICAGTSVTFTATPNNGGTTPAYQWYNGTTPISGATSSTYTSTTLVNADAIKVVMTSNATPCLTASPATSNIVTMTVNPNLPASVSIAASPSGAICAGTSVTFTATPTNGGITPAYQWYNGTTPISGATSSTYTSTTLVNADAIKVVMTSNASPCLTASPATSNIVTMVINSLPTVPTVGTIIQPTCAVQTGSFSITNYSSSYVYSVTPSTGVTISGSTVTAPAGSYTIIATSGSCTAASTPAVITPLEVVTYNGANWSSTPTINKIGEIQASGAISVNTELCSCTVNSGVNTTVNSGITLKLYDKLTVNGTLTFENNASLVQINDAAVNSGNISYKRYTAPVRRYDFTYWSSPVAGQTLKALSPNTLYDKYYSYNSGWVILYSGVAIMKPGNGYIIRAPQTFSTTAATIDDKPVFIGVPNNGEVKMGLAPTTLYLLGNPYPSAISADAFLDLNSSVLEGTLYFWTHNTPPSTSISGTALYNYTSSDYATYNKTGVVVVAKAASTGGVAPSGNIAAGQGFFAPTSSAGGNLVFNNSLRLSATGTLLNNSQFFKLSTSSKTTSAAAIDKNRIWLNLTNNQGAFKQTLIGYITGATNNYDGGFDGVSYDGNQYLDFYSVNNSVNLAIQGRALPFEANDSIALGYKSTITGEFQISIDHTDGILDSQQVFLEDKELKVLYNLKNNPYTFSAEKGIFNTRFVLRYLDKNASNQLVTNTPVLDESVVVSVLNNEIKVNSVSESISKISVYNASGELIYQKDQVAATEFIIQHLTLTNQVLVVNVVLANGTTTSNKIIY